MGGWERGGIWDGRLRSPGYPTTGQEACATRGRGVRGWGWGWRVACGAKKNTFKANKMFIYYNLQN